MDRTEQAVLSSGKEAMLWRNYVGMLSKEQELRLFERIQSGDHSAREELLQAHMPLAMNLALWKWGKIRNFRIIDRDDLIQEILLVMWKKTLSFTCKCRFSTYIFLATGGAVKDALWLDAVMPIKEKKWRRLATLLGAARREIERSGNPEPSEEKLITVLVGKGVSRKDAKRICSMESTRVVSLDQSGVGVDEIPGNRRVSAGDFQTVGAENLPDQNVRPIDEDFGQMEMMAVLYECLAELEARDRDIVEACFGLSGEEHSFPQKAVKLGISTQRVQQLQARALKRLREKMAARLGL